MVMVRKLVHMKQMFLRSEMYLIGILMLRHLNYPLKVVLVRNVGRFREFI